MNECEETTQAEAVVEGLAALDRPVSELSWLFSKELLEALRRDLVFFSTGRTDAEA